MMLINWIELSIKIVRQERDKVIRVVLEKYKHWFILEETS